MSRMWRVQRRAFCRRTAAHGRLRVAYHESGHAIGNLVHGGWRRKEFRSMVRRPAATQTRPGTAPDGRLISAFGARFGFASLADEAADEVFFHSAAWRMDGRPDRCMAYRARH